MRRPWLHRIAYCQSNRLLILLLQAEEEIRFFMVDGMFKRKINTNCHSPRLVPNTCQGLDPPYLLLPTNFKYNLELTLSTVFSSCSSFCAELRSQVFWDSAMFSMVCVRGAASYQSRGNVFRDDKKNSMEFFNTDKCSL